MSLRTSGDVLKDIRLTKGFSQIEFARLLGYKDRTTIAKLESGENSIPASRIKEVAEKLGVSEKYLTNEMERTLYVLGATITYLGDSVLVEDDFDGRQVRFSAAAWEHLKEEGDPRPVFDLLRESADTGTVVFDDPRISDRALRVGYMYDIAAPRDRKFVDLTLEPYEDQVTVPTRDTFIKKKAPVREVTLPKVKRRADGFGEITVYEDQLPAAGPSSYFDAPRGHTEQYPLELIPQGTTFAVPIAGNSMEPKFKNGATVFVQSAPRVENGEVGLFSLNGAPYIKQLVVDDARHEVRLHSLNPDYDDIAVGEYDDLRTFGRVLGSYSL